MTTATSVDNAQKSMEKIMALCKRRAFIYPASEIYGGINGFWDYGPMGAQLKKNLRDAWWQDVVVTPPIGPDGEEVTIVGLDTCIIQNPKVWEASGHVGGFNDPMVDCRETKHRYRADHLFAFVESQDSGEHLMFAFIQGDEETHERATKAAEKYASKHQGMGEWSLKPLPEISGAHFDRVVGPHAKEKGTLTEPRAFNLMFKTYIGATATEDDKAYLRPETAQGIFVQYKNVLDTTRTKVPFGIAQIGKAFRNEVTPRNFTYRSREFEQMEMEFFCHRDDARAWYAFWRDWRMQWWESIGLAGVNLQLREHEADELAHYAREGAGVCDIEYRFPFTAPDFGELEGVADRSDFDLRQHQQHTGAKLEYFDQERNERYLPNVIEPAAGLDRGVLALICEAYTPDESRPSKEFLRFHPRVAPVKAAIFPLVNKDGMPEVAEKLRRNLRARFGAIESDPKQSIGKRYARMDEVGCPYCFTVDGQTLEDQTVTVRDRDTAGQERIGVDQVESFLAERLLSR